MDTTQLQQIVDALGTEVGASVAASNASVEVSTKVSAGMDEMKAKIDALIAAGGSPADLQPLADQLVAMQGQLATARTSQTAASDALAATLAKDDPPPAGN